VALPSVDGILDALEKIYAWDSKKRKEQAKRARKQAVEYDWDRVVAAFWKPFFEGLEKELQEGKKTGHEHRWAKTGIWEGDSLCIPCLAEGCQAELAISPDGKRVIKTDGFPMSRNGVSLRIVDHPEGGVAKIVFREIFGTYGLDEIKFQPGDIVLDLGAHVGVVSIWLAKRWPGIKVIAYEPIPSNFDLLVQNIAANGVSDQVTPVQKAVMAKRGEITLEGDPSTNSGGFSAFSHGASLKHLVNAIDLEEVFNLHVPDRCRLLKMDIEGAEYEVIQAEPHLLGRVDYLSAEFHDSESLRELGYSPQKLADVCARYIAASRLHIGFSGLAG